MAPTGYRYHVFISYARRSAGARLFERIYPEFLDCLSDKLGVDDVKDSVFFDNHSAANGATVENRICGGLRESAVMLSLWSPRYFERRWCRREFQSFLLREEQVGLRTDSSSRPALIYPVKIDKVTPPPEAKDTYCRRDLTRFRELVRHPDTVMPAELWNEIDDIASDIADWFRAAPNHAPWPIAPLPPDEPPGQNPVRFEDP